MVTIKDRTHKAHIALPSYLKIWLINNISSNSKIKCKKKLMTCDNDKNAQLDSPFQHKKAGNLGIFIQNLRLFSYIFGCKKRTTVRKPVWSNR